MKQLISFVLILQVRKSVNNFVILQVIRLYSRDILKIKLNFTKISEEPWHFRYVGIVHAKIMEENQWCFEEYHLYIKNHSIFNPYVLECQGKLVEVFYVPAVNERLS